jgi:CheY-like chemotaxis protein
MASKIQIGNLLVEAGIISPKTLERSLELQKGSGKRLGSLLREMGLITEEEVLEALSRQCNLRTVTHFADNTFSKELLDLVPVSLALEKMIFPLKHYRDMLAIATLDPFDQETFQFLAEKTGMKIHLALATRSDIFAAIRKHYPVQKWAQGGKQKILLIDPSPITVKFLQTALEREGYEVFVSCDGVEGLKMAYSRHPDLILCDLMTPRMDGYTFMYALTAMVDIPVILMSAKNTPEEAHRAQKAGFADFITKPVMPIRVLVSVKKALAFAGNKAASPTSFSSQGRLSPRQLPRNMARIRQGRM